MLPGPFSSEPFHSVDDRRLVIVTPLDVPVRVGANRWARAIGKSIRLPIDTGGMYPTCNAVHRLLSRLRRIVDMSIAIPSIARFRAGGPGLLAKQLSNLRGVTPEGNRLATRLLRARVSDPDCLSGVSGTGWKGEYVRMGSCQSLITSLDKSYAALHRFAAGRRGVCPNFVQRAKDMARGRRSSV